jgi:hypothetical protein
VTPRGRPFPGDELSMPVQQGVGGCDRRDVTKDSAAEPVGQRGEPSPVGVGQSKASAIQLPAQQAILFNQIADGISLATLQPAGDDQQQHSQSRDVKHGGESISETGFLAAASIQSWNTTTSFLRSWPPRSLFRGDRLDDDSILVLRVDRPGSQSGRAQVSDAWVSDNRSLRDERRRTSSHAQTMSQVTQPLFPVVSSRP